MADEVDLLDAVEVVDDVPQRLGVLGHVVLRAGILDVEDLVAPLVAEILAERLHRRPAPHQAVEHDDGLAAHRRQAAVALDAFQSGVALVVGAPGVAEVVLVQQAAVAGERVPLDPPLVEEEFVGPELLSPQRGHGNRRRAAGGRFLARQPAGKARQLRHQHQSDAENPADHDSSGRLFGHYVTPCGPL